MEIYVNKDSAYSHSSGANISQHLEHHDFHLGDCLGKGAFGSVYRGLNMTTGETVAVKQIKLTDLPDSELRNITREIDLLKNLDHPNIVKYEGFFKSSEALNIILEYCENGSLHSISKNFGKFPENLVGIYMAQVLHGLSYLHDQGVIHRDIKGPNILLTKQGLVKLADFGVATSTTSFDDPTVVGTPYWMAPEVVELSGATTASDIWSLGCTVIELLDGKPPYHRLQPMHALFRIVNDDHPPLPEGASPVVHDFLIQCFQKDPNLRVSAHKLLKHAWICTSKRVGGEIKQKPTEYTQAVRSVQEWNEALKFPNAARHESNNNLAGPSTARPSFIDEEPRPRYQNNDHVSRSSKGRLHKAQDLAILSKLGPYANETPNAPNLIDPLDTIKPAANSKTIRQGADERAVTCKSDNFNDSKSALVTAQKRSLADTSRYMESSREDYSELIIDDALFQKQVKERKLFDNLGQQHSAHYIYGGATLISASTQHKQSGSSVMSSTRPASDESIKHISMYAEDENDADFSDILGAVNLVSSNQGCTPFDGRTEALVLNSRLSSQPSIREDEDDDDPFAQLEEGFSQVDLNANVARDRYARLCKQVEGLVCSLKTSKSDRVLSEISQQLLSTLYEMPEITSVVISAHGMLPILEILETCRHRKIVVEFLKIVNLIITRDIECKENLCFVGGIPIITQYASKKLSSDIRLEAATFIRQMFQSSALTLQMFVSTGGLKVLVEFLEEDFDDERELVLTGVNGIWSVFELQGSTPKNDFCRILSRNSVLDPLSLVLSRVLDEQDDVASLCEGRIAHIFFIFSQAENHVKELIAERTVLHRVLKELRRMTPTHMITMLKFIKNLSMLSTTLDALQNSNAIDVLVDILRTSANESHYRELSNQILNTIYNLCRLNKSRSEDAALNGIVPVLQQIIRKKGPLKEFALPILCDMAASGKVGRRELWRNKGLPFYICLLGDEFWQVTALDAILIWLQEETAKVEDFLVHGTFTRDITHCFVTAKANSFENLLEPLQKLLRLSPPIARLLANEELLSRLCQKLTSQKAVVRLGLLRIVRSICDVVDDHADILRRFELEKCIQGLSRTDGAVLVRNMASDILHNSVQSVIRKTSGSRSSRLISPIEATTNGDIRSTDTPSDLSVIPSMSNAFVDNTRLHNTAAIKTLASAVGETRHRRLQCGDPPSSSLKRSRLPRTSLTRRPDNAMLLNKHSQKVEYRV